VSLPILALLIWLGWQWHTLELLYPAVANALRVFLLRHPGQCPRVGAVGRLATLGKPPRARVWIRHNTVDEFLQFWREHDIKTIMKPGTYANYVQDVERHIVPVLRAIRLKKLRAPQIQRWLNGITIKSAINPYQRLRAALDKAVRWGYIAKNYAREVEPPSYTPPAIHP
jgi:hypothetical protein